MIKRRDEQAGCRRVLIADDLPLMRDALRRLIDAEPGLGVCATAADAGEATAAIEQFEPDVVVLSPHLPGQTGFELLRETRSTYPGVHVLVFSPQRDSAQAAEALLAGAKGYISKQEEGQAIIAAIRHVAEGKRWVSRDVMPDVLDRCLGKELAHESIRGRLTKREFQVFEMIGKGIATRRIAEYLYISQRTVESHRDHIKAKLQVEDVFKLHQLAFEWVGDEIARGG